MMRAILPFRHLGALAALAALCLGLAGPASADPPVLQDRDPEWARRPTAEELYALMPAEAIRRGAGGMAVLDCTVTVVGALAECQVISETPAGVGFGAAALAMTPQLSFHPAIRNGAPAPATVRIPLRFNAWESPGDTRMGTQHVVQYVPWAQAPSVADLAAVFQARSVRQRVAGSASLSCLIGRDGRLHSCDMMSQQPADQGFGEAARRLSSRFRAPVDQPSFAPLIGARTQLRFSFPLDLPAPGQPAIGHPAWAAQPQGGMPGSAYPAAAEAAHIADGRVVLRCLVGPDGHLTGCATIREQPAGYGFAQAATALSAGFVMSLWTDDGLPTIGASVVVPVHYALPAPPPAAPAPAAP